MTVRSRLHRARADLSKLTKEMVMFSDWYETLLAAKVRARQNGRNYAFAVQWPDGHCTVEDAKPSLRNQHMRVIECDCTGKEYLA